MTNKLSFFRSFKSFKSFKSTKSFLILLLIGLLAHWPSLISDSLMWDDYNVLPWMGQSRWDWAFQFLHNYGVTPYFIAYLPFFIFKNNVEAIVWLAKVLTLTGIILNGTLIFLLSLDLTKNRVFAWIAAIAAICAPSTSGEGFHLSSIIYYLFIPLFYFGMHLFVGLYLNENTKTAESWHQNRWVIRSFALIALFLSFSFNSLLMFYYGLMPALLYAAIRSEEKINLISIKKQLKRLAIKYCDFLLLPVLFWLIKEIFMPRQGLYLRYNAFIPDWASIGAAFKRLIPNLLEISVINPFSGSHALLLSASLLILAVIVFISWPRYGHLISKELSRTPNRQWIIMLALALFLLACAAFPYYLVGRRSFEPYGFMTRDNILFSLPIAWITASIFCMLANVPFSFERIRSEISPAGWNGIVFSILIALWISQSLANWRNQADWQAHYAYYRSASLQMAEEPLVRNASVLQIVDQLPQGRTLKSFRYPASVWSGILAIKFNDSKRLALPEIQERKQKYSLQEIKQRRMETEVDFMYSNVDILGRQVRVIVQPTYNKDDISLAIDYWRTRFFAPHELNQWLSSLTSIEVQSL